MKCGKLAGLLMLVVFFLFVGGCFSSGFAAGAARGEQSSRAAGLAAEAPKTPEEFLRLVRAWMDDPYMDGYEFAERIIGVERGKWGEPKLHFGAVPGNKVYFPGHYIRINKIRKIPYAISILQITSNNHLWDIIIPFPDKSFCVSAGLVKDILGEPTVVKKKMPSKYSEKISNYTPLFMFIYKTNQFKIKFRFGFDKSRFGNILELPKKERLAIWRYINNPDNYGEICATRCRFGTYEGR